MKCTSTKNSRERFGSKKSVSPAGNSPGNSNGHQTQQQQGGDGREAQRHGQRDDPGDHDGAEGAPGHGALVRGAEPADEDERAHGTVRRAHRDAQAAGQQHGQAGAQLDGEAAATARAPRAGRRNCAPTWPASPA